jgi:putative ABC transport system permease protein
VRLALGASRFRIARHLFADSLVLVAVSTLISLGLAHWLVKLLMDAMRGSDDGGPPLWMRFDIDAGSVAIAVFVGLLTAIAAGLWPALKLSGQASTALRSGARASTAGMSKKLSGIMIALELACAAALLIGSLNLASYVNQSFVFDLGERTHRLVGNTISDARKTHGALPRDAPAFARRPTSD